MFYLFVNLMVAWNVSAAIPNKQNDQKLSVGEILRQSHAQALQSVRMVGPAMVDPLMQMAFNEKWPMKSRWKAFMLLTQFQKKKSLPVIEKALKNETWYMRSAGLTAIKDIDAKKAKKWARRLLKNDRALLVRMKAFEILKNNKDNRTVSLFWQKVFSKDSLHAGKSLWLREDLVKTLVRSPRSKDLIKWVQLLHDSDVKMNHLASVALSQLHKDHRPQGGDLSFWKKKFEKDAKVVR